MIERLLIRLRTLPFIIVATALPDARPHTLVDAARANPTLMGVEPLDEASVGALASALIGDDVDGWAGFAAEPNAMLHLYGKTDARPGRKMGHVTRLK